MIARDLLPPADNVQVKMKDHLPAAPLHIEKQFVPGLRNTELRRHVPGHPDHMTDNPQIVIGHIIDAANMSLRYHQQVHRRLGMNILEYHNPVILIREYRIRLTR